MEKRHQTALSDFVWSCKEEELDPKVTYKVLAKAPAYTADRGKCALCLQEKVKILMAEGSNYLNKKSEICNKCRHKHKWSLAGWDPSVT